jgi:hypothetical protein
VVAFRIRWRIVSVAVVTSLLIVAVPLIFGAGMHVLSFVTAQTARGIQVEAPISTFWMWQALLRVPGAQVYYDAPLNTFQVSGAGTAAAGELMNPLFAVSAVVIVLIGIRAVMRDTPVTRVLPELSLALVTAFIAFNKVGSPQYVAWLAAPVVIGIAYQGRGFRTPAILVGIIAALTQVFYPFLYDWLLALDPTLVVVLTLRNLMYFAVLAWAVAALWRKRHRAEAAWDLLPAHAWPFRTPRGAEPQPATVERH